MAKKFFRRKILVAKLPPQLRFKWGEPALDEGVTGIPIKLVRNLAKIFPDSDGVEQLQVALTLVDYRREDETRLPTAAFLAFLAGLSEEAFVGQLEKLKGHGLINYQLVRKAVSFDVTGLLRAIEAHAKWQPPVRAESHEVDGDEEEKDRSEDM
jgi:hypothetical protein